MKVAIVTGASRGIGLSIAKKLAREKINLALCSKNKENLRKAENFLKENFDVEIYSENFDISNYPAVKNFVENVYKKFGRIDILVNNAGILVVGKLNENKIEEIDYLIKVNLLAPIYFCKEVIPIMIKQKNGIIINISSGAGKTGFANLAVYCASKFGLNGLTESLAKELSNYNIKVYSICPGPVKTDMQYEYLKKLSFHERILTKAFMQEPDEIAEFVLNAIKGKYKSGSIIDTI